jgi:hypothetical protein
MKVLFKVDGDGNGYVAALDTSHVDSSVAEHRKAATVPKGQEIELDFPDVLSAEQIGFGNVTDSESGDVVTETPGSDEGQAGADKPGGGNEGSPAAGQDQGQGQGNPDPVGSPEPGTPADQTTDPSSSGTNAGGGEGGQQPAGGGDLGGAQTGEPASTSAASEKPLYLVQGDVADGVPEGFEASGLETPDGTTLYHFASDTEGQAATGNRDGVSVYADADDNEKPVKPATPAEGQEKTAA